MDGKTIRTHSYASRQSAAGTTRFLQDSGNVLIGAARVGAGFFTGGVPGAVFGLAGASGVGGQGFDMQQLIQLQIDKQRELQSFTMQSNIAKTEHESRMAAVRNMRA